MIPRRLLVLTLRVKWHVLASIVAILAVTSTYLATALATATALGALTRGEASETLAWIAIVAATVLARAVLIPVRTAITTSAGLAVRRILRDGLLHHVMALGPEWASKSRLGAAQATIVEGVDGLDPYYSEYLPQLAVTVTLPAGIVAGVWLLHPPSAVFLACCLLVTLIVPRFKDAAMLRQGSERWRAYVELSADYLEAMRGIPTLRTFGAAERRRDLLEARSTGVYRATMRPLRTSLLENGITVGFTLFGTFGAVFLATLAATRAQLPGTHVLYVLMLSVECFRPVRDLAKAWHAGYLGLTASDGVDAILRARPAVADTGTGTLTLGGAAEVSVHEVAYTYPAAARPALDQVSARIPAGQLTAVVGASGAGKSTFAALISRRLDPDSGRVEIGSTDLRRVSLASLRANLAVVGQRTRLFHDTVAANVRLGAPEATDDEVRAALAEADALGFVEELPEGIHTMLSEDATTLSGGQRQRLALARALIRRTPVLLLDEPTSNVDRHSDAHIMGTLRSLTPRHTIVVIAHRLESIMSADQVIVFDSGRIVEQGEPGALVSSGGALATLLRDERTRQKPAAEPQEVSRAW